ncbi:MAG: DUF4112 domain-containing protein [Alteromonadaceae bacterium]|nr:DUF4112 domain-containing protein [Alteromonadaceae bacterium]
MTIKAPDELLYAQRLANITDTAIRIPIVGISVGLDFLIGLIPVVGDAIMALVSLRIVHLARKMGLPKHLQKVMIRNSGLDFMFGFIPVVGDIVDLFYKANKANVKIMETWWLEQNQQELNQHTQHTLREWQKSDV